MGSAGGVCYPAGSAISQIFFEMSELCNNSDCFSVEIKGTSDICVTFVVYACGKSIRNICLHSGGKKKTADGQTISCAFMTPLYPYGGFEKSEPPFLFVYPKPTTT